MQHVYGLFGFEFRLELSTRPDKYLGALETWNTAEEVSMPNIILLECISNETIPQQLTKALDKFYPGKWDLNPGDGAFYGPKIDIKLNDA